MASVPNKSENISSNEMSPRVLWGKVIIYLREHHSVALHIACGDITDVNFDGETFYVNTTDNILYDLLKAEDNLKDLKMAFESFNVKKFEIIKKEKTLSKSQEDIQKLKSIFGDKLIIE